MARSWIDRGDVPACMASRAAGEGDLLPSTRMRLRVGLWTPDMVLMASCPHHCHPEGNGIRSADGDRHRRSARSPWPEVLFDVDQFDERIVISPVIMAI